MSCFNAESLSIINHACFGLGESDVLLMETPTLISKPVADLGKGQKAHTGMHLARKYPGA